MKELHNHIFSNTTCISKQTMLKYINHQLSEKELHDVEKHMLDCEFCSDAIEGLRYAENSSVLFTIDNKIDQRAKTESTQNPIMRNLMVAASICVIVFGSYFTLDYFNETISKETELAVNKNDFSEDEMVTLEEPKEELEVLSNGNQQEELSDVVLSKELVQEDKVEVLPEVPKVVSPEQVPMLSEIVEEEDVELVMVEELHNESIPTTSLSNNLNFHEEVDDVENDVAIVKMEERKLDKKQTKSTNKKAKNRYKTYGPSFSTNNYADAPQEEMDMNANENEEGTITLSNHKVVDYIDEYQKQYDMQKMMETNRSTAADYENKEDAEEAERTINETTVEVTYRATLEKAMAYYDAKKYTLALDQFVIILKEHPDEVNTLFYGGLCNYHLQRYGKALAELDKVLTNAKTSFNEEAEWYKALILIELEKTTAAKQLLQEIIDAGGFYKAKAQQKLKKL